MRSISIWCFKKERILITPKIPKKWFGFCTAIALVHYRLHWQIMTIFILQKLSQLNICNYYDETQKYWTNQIEKKNLEKANGSKLLWNPRNLTLQSDSPTKQTWSATEVTARQRPTVVGDSTRDTTALWDLVEAVKSR